MNDAMPAIAVEGLGKSFRLGALVTESSLRARLMGLLRGGGGTGEELWALREVSFTIAQGEAVGIIGRNGSGKSTLLKILARITQPSTGEARIRGRIGSMLEVGTGFHPELTGRENVFLGGAVIGMRRAEIARRFAEIVAFAELEAFIDTPVKRYSSGMYMRLAFAVAAHLETEILLIDEVLAVGDAAFQRRCLGAMSDLARRGRTVLFVSHNLGAVRSLCPRSLWLDGGRLRAAGESPAVIAGYLDATATTSDLAVEFAAPARADAVFAWLDIAVVQGGRRTTSLFNGEPFEVHITYQVKTPTHGLRILIDLFDAQHDLLMRSFDDERAEAPSSVAPGRYLATALVPAELLPKGPHHLEVSAMIQWERFLAGAPLLIPLDLNHTANLNRGYKPDIQRGKLLSLLRWSTRKVADG